jgi:AcrR family transcriptional regulator
MTIGPDPEDLTARARIRNAALVHFGEQGFERTTIRGIAEAAGVSSGLVRHHFGSKQALREACDEYLVRVMHELNDRARADSTFGEVNYVAAARAVTGPYQSYLVRALAEGSAASVFDEMVGMSEEWLADADEKRPDPPEVDRKVRAALVTAMALGVPILREHLSRNLGVDLFSPEGDQLLARALVDIYSHPALSPEEAALARAGLDRARDESTGANREFEEQQDD